MKNSHLQDLNKVLTILVMILVISIPVRAEELIQLPTAEEIKEAFKEQEFAEFAIIAKTYEPKVLRSSLIEQNNVPIYIHLAAIKTDPTLSFPRIQPPLIVKEMSNKSYFVGGIKYHQPKIYSWDDIGYLEARLKKIPIEKNVPENIKTDLKIKINYEAESIAGEIKSIREQKEQELKRGITEKSIIEDDNYVFSAGRGYIVVDNIGRNGATYKVYDEELNYLGSLSSTIGFPSTELRLTRTSTELRDRIRVRTDEIKDFSQANAKITIDGEDKILTKGSKIKGWTVIEVSLENKKTPNFIYLYKPRIGEVFLSDSFAYEGDTRPDKILFKNNQAYIEMRNRYEILKNDFGIFSTPEFKSGDKIKATLAVSGAEEKYEEGQKIPNTACAITRITSNSVTISHPLEITTRGITNSVQTSTTLILERFEQFRNPVYQPETATPRTENYLPYTVCGQTIVLKDIDFKKSVKFTILPPRIRGSTETKLSINIPIEKKPWDPSPKTLDKLINKTEKQIKLLDEKIEKLEQITTKWRKVCLGTAATFTALSFLTGFESEKTIKERELAKKRTVLPAGITYQGKSKGGCGENFKPINFYDSPTKEHRLFIQGNNYATYYIEKITGVTKGKAGEELKTIGKTVCDLAGNSVIYNEQGEPYIYDRKTHELKKYTGIDKKQFGSIRTISTDEGTGVIIPIKDFSRLPLEIQKQYPSWRIQHGWNKETGLYAVYKDNTVEFWTGSGIPDAGYDVKDDSLKDKSLVSYSKNSIVYKQFTNTYITRVRNAQRLGVDTLDIGSDKFRINPNIQEFAISKVSCNDVMPDWQCKILYNACDPVMCPPSRCDLGGRHKVQNVIKSGLVGSTVLCLPNIQEGVLVPVCLTGILASLKNIRSYLKEYDKCLIIKKTEGKSIGMCEKLRSFSMCQIVWKDVLPLILNIGKKLLTPASPIGGSEYVEGASSGLESATKTFNFFTNNYAKEIFAAYRAATTAQLGAEICKSAIGGSLPNFGKIVDSIAAPEDPVQYTAWLEEHDFSTTKSSYQVYYHVYAGRPKLKETVNYVVTLRATNKPSLIIAQGVLRKDDQTSETKEIIKDKGYNEICVAIDNTPPKCGFGKIVSTSLGLQQITDKVLGLSTEKKVTSTKQCVSGAVGIDIGITQVHLPQIPQPSIIRQCAPSNPYGPLSPKKAAEWRSVGECIDEDGTYRGICWAKLNTQKYPEIEEASGVNTCKGEGLTLCEKGKICAEGAAISTFNGRICCSGGECKTAAEKEKLSEEEIIAIQTQKTAIQKINSLKCQDATKYHNEEIKSLIIKIESKINTELLFIIGKKCLGEKDYNTASEYLDEAYGKLQNIPELSSKDSEYKYYTYLSDFGNNYINNELTTNYVDYLIKSLDSLKKDTNLTEKTINKIERFSDGLLYIYYKLETNEFNNKEAEQRYNELKTQSDTEDILPFINKEIEKIKEKQQ